MPLSENVCRFKGILIEYSTRYVGNDDYLMGKGKLYLPGHRGEPGPSINLLAWEDVAKRLSEVGKDVWIEVGTSYTPETFRNKLIDNFVVGAFRVINE